jgi:hypothetical protein
MHTTLACVGYREEFDYFVPYLCSLSLYFCLVHITSTCAEFEKEFDHFESYVYNIFLHLCKRVFPGLEQDFFFKKRSVQLNQSTPKLLKCNTGFKYIKKEP